MDVASDFFEYFAAVLPLMHADPSIYCASAWNDNGQAKFVSDPSTFIIHT